MKQITKTVLAASLALLLAPPLPALAAGNPLFLSGSKKGSSATPLKNLAKVKKDAKILDRKAKLLKAAADKKYAESRKLRRRAGGFRSDAHQKGEELRSRANKSQATANFLGTMFDVMSAAGGYSGSSSSSGAMFAQSIAGGVARGAQNSAASQTAHADSASGQLQMDADKKAGPLEMRADELESDGNRLMDAHNKLRSLANAKLLLVASEQLRKKLSQDERYLKSLEKRTRKFLAQFGGR